MAETLNQRWRDGRDRYRPPAEVIDTRRYEVAELSDDATPKAFVVKHHYSASFPAARRRMGLYRSGELVGVAVFSHPPRDSVLTDVFPGDAKDSMELGRFVLLDDVPGNGETWFLARCFQLLRGDLVGVVSFSDPFPRAGADGSAVFPGHVGTIYQAHNAVYLGRGQRRSIHLLPDGRCFSARAIQKIRAMDRGWRYSAAVLERFGAAPLSGDSRAWLKTWLPRLTRCVRHPGNHRYAWAIDRGARKLLPASLPYPKQLEAG